MGQRVDEQQPARASLFALDAKGCRSNAIVERESGFPVFGPLDEPEPPHDDETGALAHPLYH